MTRANQQMATGAVDEEISVIIPTWNRWPRVRDAVASVLAQSQPPLEILVVDDGSDDGTGEALAEAFAEHLRHDASPRLRLLRIDEQRGVSAARNHGIAAARGEWLAFLDSDDLWEPRKLERQMTALDEGVAADEADDEADDGAHWIVHCDELWIRNGRRVNPRRRHAKRGGWIYLDCLPLCAISPSAVVIHRRVFDQLGTFDESLPACEDYDLWLRLTAQYPVLYVDEPLVRKFGGHEDQLSRRTPALDRYRIQALDKSLNNPAVVGEARQQTLATLRQKLKIYTAGVRKRGRNEEVAALDALHSKWFADDASLGDPSAVEEATHV